MTDHPDGLTDRQVARLRRDARRRHGLPLKITDSATLARIARLLWPSTTTSNPGTKGGANTGPGTG